MSAQQATLLQTLIDAIPLPIFYKDAAARYLGCNAAFLEFLGCRSEDLLGKSVFDLSPPDLAAKYHAMDTALFDAPGTQQVYEAQVQNSRGERRQVVFYKATFNDQEGHLGGLVGSILDITEKRLDEAGLRLRDRAIDAMPLGVTISDVCSKGTPTVYCSQGLSG